MVAESPSPRYTSSTLGDLSTSTAAVGVELLLLLFSLLLLLMLRLLGFDGVFCHCPFGCCYCCCSFGYCFCCCSLNCCFPGSLVGISCWRGGTANVLPLLTTSVHSLESLEICSDFSAPTVSLGAAGADGVASVGAGFLSGQTFAKCPTTP